ncbi:MAG: hypothetical protein Fur0040_08690 [Sideroxydans sp.]
MDKRIILSLFAFIVVVGTTLLLLPTTHENDPETLPWRISHPTPETSRVFGLTLGASTLEDVENFLHDTPEVSLFKTADGTMGVEAYFDEINLNGLKAKFALTLDVPQTDLEGLFARGARLNATPTGKRVTLAKEDLAQVRAYRIKAISYLPAVRIEEAILEKRFGIAAEKIREKESGVVHWLYPDKGLDIALQEKQKPVLQYVAPPDFAALRTPLLAHGEVLPSNTPVKQ